MIDIIFNILLYSKVKDIVNICLCNKQCLTLLNNQYFWQYKYHIEQLPILDTLCLKNYYNTKKAVLTVQHVVDHYKIYNTNEIHLELLFNQHFDKVISLLPKDLIFSLKKIGFLRL
jgi:hypothetical protein